MGVKKLEEIFFAAVTSYFWHFMRILNLRIIYHVRRNKKQHLTHRIIILLRLFYSKSQ